jgi:hypothetical protein
MLFGIGAGLGGLAVGALRQAAALAGDEARPVPGVVGSTLRGETGDQTDQESRSARSRAATSMIVMG